MSGSFLGDPGSEDPGLEMRAATSGLVVIGSSAVQLGIGLAATAVLARLLRPADFGLIAMAAVLFGSVLSIKNLGLSLAIVQRDSIRDEELSALFWLSLGLTAALAQW